MNNKVKNNPEEPNAAPLYQNHVRLVGFLGKDPEHHENRAVLSLATKASWTDKTSGDWKSRTDWHRVTAWPPIADAVRTLATGDHVIVEGELRTGQYEREVQVNGGDIVTVTTKTVEICARSVRKLVFKKKETPEPAATAA